MAVLVFTGSDGDLDIITGNYYDGKVSAQTRAFLKVYDNGALRIERVEDGELLLSSNLQSAQVSDRIAHIPRVLTFADQGTFETPDNAAVDRMLKQHGGSDWSRWVHLLESRKRFVLLAAVLVIAFAVAMVRYGIPAAAQRIAEAFKASFCASVIAPRLLLRVIG